MALFEPIGELELKGLPEPVPACQAYWDDVQDDNATPFPALLAASGTLAYVGRDADTAAAIEAWRHAASGRARTILVAGEPGIGKTRFAAEVAGSAHRDGAVVLFGRCDEDVGPPYQPVAEALEWWLANAPAGALPGSLGAMPGELARLVPDLVQRVSGVGAPTRSSDNATEEWRLQEGVLSWLATVASGTGLVLVLDDLHWAGAPTVALLMRVIRTLHATESSRVLIIGTYRDTDLDRSTPLTASLADLRRLEGVVRMAFTGLTRDELEAFAAAAAGHDLDAPLRQLAHTIYEETEGNPFFVGEILRHLVETGAIHRDGERWAVDERSVTVPDGIREVVGRRVDRLPVEANEILQTAAVLGRDLPFDVLAAVVSHPDSVILDALDAAARARLVEEVGADRWRFTHALVRTTLYDELSATRRRRLHRQIVEALEKLHPDDTTSLAHHALSAGPDGGDAARAIHWAVSAGQRSLDALAWDDAERLFAQALEVAEDADHDELDRVDALVGLAAARFGGARPARDQILAATRAALEVGDSMRAAIAVTVEPPTLSSTIAEPDEERIELIERVLAALPIGSVERALVQVSFGVEVYFTDRIDEGRAAVRDALRVADDAGDDPLLLIATAAWLNIKPFLWWDDEARALQAAAPWHTDRYFRVIEIIAELIAAWVNGLTESASALDRQTARAGSRRARSAGSDLPDVRPRRCRHPGGPARRRRALCDFGLTQAEGRADAMYWWQAYIVRMALDDGTMHQLADVATAIVDANPRGAGYPWALPLVLVEAGRIEEARSSGSRRLRATPAISTIGISGSAIAECWPWRPPLSATRCALARTSRPSSPRTTNSSTTGSCRGGPSTTCGGRASARSETRKARSSASKLRSSSVRGTAGRTTRSAPNSAWRP